MSRPKRTILLVEDETSIREPLAEVLRSEGFETLVAGTVAEALEQARAAPDLVLLDVMLPDGSGFDVCRELRRDSQVPIIMLTARGEEADGWSGSSWAPTTTWSSRSAGARWSRGSAQSCGAPPRLRPPTTGGRSKSADVRLDPAKREVTLRGETLELSRKEFELLQLLMRNAGSVVTRERLIDEVWDPNWFGSTKTLDVHVSGIRRKLGDDAGEPRYLHTVRGVGFRFSSPDEVGMSLRLQLLGAFAYVLLLIIVALEVPLALNLAKRIDAEVKNEAAGQAFVVAASASGQMEHPKRLAQVVRTRRRTTSAGA